MLDILSPQGEIWKRRLVERVTSQAPPPATPPHGLPLRLVLPDPPRSSSLDHTFHLPLPCCRPPGPQPTCFGITFKEKFLFSSHPARLSPPPAARPGCGPRRALVDTSPAGQDSGRPPPPGRPQRQAREVLTRGFGPNLGHPVGSGGLWHRRFGGVWPEKLAGRPP